jgi:hypothetical protein
MTQIPSSNYILKPTQKQINAFIDKEFNDFNTGFKLENLLNYSDIPSNVQSTQTLNDPEWFTIFSEPLSVQQSNWRKYYQLLHILELGESFEKFNKVSLKNYNGLWFDFLDSIFDQKHPIRRTYGSIGIPDYTNTQKRNIIKNTLRYYYTLKKDWIDDKIQEKIDDIHNMRRILYTKYKLNQGQQPHPIYTLPIEVLQNIEGFVYPTSRRGLPDGIVPFRSIYDNKSLKSQKQQKKSL